MKRGDVYLANLEPTKGAEQAGCRPVLVFQHNLLNRVTRTVVVIPFTTNLHMARLPSCALVPAGEGGLRQDSVAICHQIRALDKSGLLTYWGTLPFARLVEVERVVTFTLGMQRGS
jgi:mRNA interferase MazF